MCPKHFGRGLLLCLFAGIRLCAQIDSGELRITVADVTGLPVIAAVELASDVNQYHHTFEADLDGRVVAKRLPFGIYQVTASRSGFAPASATAEIRSSIPKELALALAGGAFGDFRYGVERGNFARPA